MLLFPTKQVKVFEPENSSIAVLELCKVSQLTNLEALILRHAWLGTPNLTDIKGWRVAESANLKVTDIVFLGVQHS